MPMSKIRFLVGTSFIAIVISGLAQAANYTNTHVSAGNQLTLESGGDTNLKGATATGKQVIADIGGDLNIASLQDTSTYTSQQNSAGFGVSLCIPPFCTGVPASEAGRSARGGGSGQVV